MVLPVLLRTRICSSRHTCRVTVSRPVLILTVFSVLSQYISPSTGEPVCVVSKITEFTFERVSVSLTTIPLDCTHFAPPSPRTSALSAIVVAEVTSPVPLTVPHRTPVTSAVSAIGTVPFAPIARREAVFAPVPITRSPLASQIASVATDPPPPEYCGILRLSPMRVAAPLVPVVVRVISPCFPSS